MAKQKGNVVTHGLSGKIGDLLVFRQVGGKTVVSKVPEPPKTVSEKQAKQRRRFRQAVIYAKSAVESPETKTVYDEMAAKKGKTPFIVAVADFLHVPEIQRIDLSDYSGQIGDTIRIEVEDDTMVKYVHVRIMAADGTLIEEGQATPDISGYVWTYAAEQNNDRFNYGKIVVSVSDLPGNVVEESEELI
ncbi:MAG: hypothetical protein LBL04_01610 [Bacteroidales bacterium]|jgi:hypothetical protein|nr:hypothetical protein [Bacteroidales bacterium]